MLRNRILPLIALLTIAALPLQAQTESRAPAAAGAPLGARMEAFLREVEDSPNTSLVAYFPRRGDWTWAQTLRADGGGPDRTGTWRFPAAETQRAIGAGGPVCDSFDAGGGHSGPWEGRLGMYARLHAGRWRRVRGGRFVSGFSGEQFALPEAAAALRKTAQAPGLERVAVSGVDPLNLAGIVTPGDKLPRLPGNRVLFEGGVPVAMQSGGEVRYLRELAPPAQWEIQQLLIRRQQPASFMAPGSAGPQ